MITVLDFLNQYGMPLMFLGQIALAIAVLYLKGQFASKSLESTVAGHHEKNTSEVNRLDKRVTLLEEKSKDLPTLSDLHRLETQICAIAGDMKRMEESVEGTESSINRQEKSIVRIEQFLLESRK